MNLRRFSGVKEFLPGTKSHIDPRSKYDRAKYLSIKISSNDIPSTLSHIEKAWKSFSPNYPFNYRFLDERIDRMYRAERQLGRSFQYFTFIAIFIACLGLFGLSSFTTAQKTREIGIRKVLGASVSGIIFLLSRQFTKWVLVANLIAWPLGYFFMNQWLQKFAYHIQLGIRTFIFSACAALVIALMTVSCQSIKAALVNPVESLKSE